MSGPSEVLPKPSRITLDNCFDQPEFSDARIKVGDRMFYVHRVILSAQSAWFKKAFTGNFKEAESGIVELHDDSVDGITAMLMHCYGQDWASHLKTNPKDNMQLFCQELIAFYQIADKYDVRNLQREITYKFRPAFQQQLQSIDQVPSIVLKVVETTSSSIDLLRITVISELENLPFAKLQIIATDQSIAKTDPEFVILMLMKRLRKVENNHNTLLKREEEARLKKKQNRHTITIETLRSLN